MVRIKSRDRGPYCPHKDRSTKGCVCVALRVNLPKFTRQDVLVLTFVSKRPTAFHAAEALWVPVLIQSRDHFLRRAVRTRVTSGGLRHYSGFSRQISCVTHLMGASHVQNGLVAVGAVWGEEGEVVRLAVRPPILLKEVAVP